MKSILFVARLKPLMLKAYQQFGHTITGPRKSEFKDLLKRYGLRSVKVYIYHHEGTDFVLIYHEAENDALERLSHWASSKHPFDSWFGEELNRCYVEGWQESKLLFELDAR